MNRISQKGFILYTAIVIAFLTMMWAVAAIYRVNHQTGATVHSHRKSEVYYLAKQAASRALFKINSVPDWVTSHSSSASADTSTPGTKAWIEDDGSQKVLFAEAKVASETRTLKVPIRDISEPSTKLFSLSPSENGPDLISWATTLAGDWKGLPPIPGASVILSTAVTSDGDVYAAVGDQPTGVLWRYRTGQGWTQMPDLPTGVQVTELSCSGNARLVGKGSDNTLLRLPLGSSAGVTMSWEAVPAPGGANLQHVEIDPKGADKTVATASASGSPQVHVYDGNNWIQHAVPTGTTNLDGGLTIDANGNIYVAENSNSSGTAATIYKLDSTASGLSPSDWEALPPVPAIEWVGSTALNPTGTIEQIARIEADPKDGSLWVQWDDPNGTNKHNMVNFPVP
jgi:hypothetical protein